MKLEKQVCCIGNAKDLAKKGVEQSSSYAIWVRREKGRNDYDLHVREQFEVDGRETWAAFTSDELEAMIPPDVTIGVVQKHPKKIGGVVLFDAMYRFPGYSKFTCIGVYKLKAKALASLVSWLLREKDILPYQADWNLKQFEIISGT